MLKETTAANLQTTAESSSNNDTSEEDKETGEKKQDEPDCDAKIILTETIFEDSDDSKQYYRLEDDELEYNVLKLKDRFDRLVANYSGFEEDIYQIPESDIMDIFHGSLAIDSYGILVWVLCMDQLETERLKIIWDILQFLSMRMPTQVAMSLLIHYSSNMARYSPSDVSELGKSLVHGSQFPLATCLVLSAFFLDAASKDLTREEQLKRLSTEYALRATEIIGEIENDYLAVIMLETPSFHAGQSPLEIALSKDIIDFLSCNKVSRISNAMWTLPNLMEVSTEASASFALSDFSASDVHGALLQDSYSFYFSSMGYFVVEVLTYIIYLVLFTYLTRKRDNVTADITLIDYLFWLGNIGFVIGEILEIGYEGWKRYLTKWQNWLDLVISINFLVIIAIRAFVGIGQALLAEKRWFGPEEIDGTVLNIIYKIIWSINIIILWLRLLHFMMLQRSVGPLITNIKNMIKDIISFSKMYILVVCGFACGLYFLIGGKYGNVFFKNVPDTVVTLIRTTLGELEWECIRQINVDYSNYNNNLTAPSPTITTTTAPTTYCPGSALLDGCTCDYDGGCCKPFYDEAYANLAVLLLIFFTFMSLIVLFNLLTAMMATTFRLITERSDKEVLSRKVALGVEYDKKSQVMPPPFNMIVIILFILYSGIDMLLLVFTQKFLSETFGKLQWKCTNCNCLNNFIEEEIDDFGNAETENDYPTSKSLNSHLLLNADDNRARDDDEKNPVLPSIHSNHICQLCRKLNQNIKPKRRLLRNPREYSQGDGRWKTFVMGLKELFDIKQNEEKKNKRKKRKTKNSKTKVSSARDKNADDNEDNDFHDELVEKIKKKDWICGYCRYRVPAGQSGLVETFENRLNAEDIRVDHDDIEAIQQIIPLMCPICYRVVSVRSRFVFILEIISYYCFLFLLYPVMRIVLIPVYFIQLIASFTGTEDDNKGDKEEFFDVTVKHNSNVLNKNLNDLEEVLPSDTYTRSLLNQNNKIWRVLDIYQRKQKRIEDKEEAKNAHRLAELSKKQKQIEHDKLTEQRGIMVANLGILIDKYWKERLDESKMRKVKMLAIEEQSSM